MGPVMYTAGEEVASQEYLLMKIFDSVPLSCALNICCTSRFFNKVWNISRYEKPFQALLQHRQFNEICNKVVCLKSKYPSPDFIRNLVLKKDPDSFKFFVGALAEAIKHLRTDDKKHLFSAIRPITSSSLHSKIIELFIKAKEWWLPWTPQLADLLENPQLLKETLETGSYWKNTEMPVLYGIGPYGYLAEYSIKR